MGRSNQQIIAGTSIEIAAHIIQSISSLGETSHIRKDQNIPEVSRPVGTLCRADS